MIDLKCCTVLVNNKAEYIALIKEAQKQGFTWASGYDLTNIFCDFPTRLRFNGECKVYYNSSAYFYNRDYQCAEWLEELKSYKEAEEQGLLVRLPCPVGTTVWDICGMDIRENVVCGIECGKNGKQFLWANHDEWLGELNDLVFLTREAAEKKLEEF